MFYFVYPQLRKLSGAERLILKLADYVTRAGERVTLVTHRFADECRPALGAQVRVVETHTNLSRFNQHYLDAPFEYLASPRLLSLIGRDARAVTFFGPPSLPALWWSRSIAPLKIPYLYFCYEPPRFAYSDTDEVGARLGPLGGFAARVLPLYRFIDRALVGRADVLLANSSFGAGLLASAYRRPATVITHGADFDPPDPARVAELEAAYKLTDRPVVLTVNFLHPRKRIDLYLQALDIVRKAIPNVLGLIVGAGPERSRLETLADKLGLCPNVRFTGFIPDRDLPAHYALADVYVNPAKLESFGLSVLEASAASLPVVSVNEGGPREIIADGETGFLTAASPDALADKICALLSDDAKRAQFGRAGRERVDLHYQWQFGARAFLDAVAQATAGHGPAQ